VSTDEGEAGAGGRRGGGAWPPAIGRVPRRASQAATNSDWCASSEGTTGRVRGGVRAGARTVHVDGTVLHVLAEAREPVGGVENGHGLDSSDGARWEQDGVARAQSGVEGRGAEKEKHGAEELQVLYWRLMGWWWEWSKLRLGVETD
jgi:hypothetical protein